VAVLFVDLDHFKPINDALGHAVGDEVLKEVASRLVRHVRVSDTVARVGGDEFVVALGRQRDESGPIDVAKKIIKALARPYRTLKGTKGPGCSIGITLFPDDGQDPGMLIKLADAAMYYVKNHQRGSYAFHSRQEAPQSRPKPA
jgi:diguanylate cyclase (GGDEF)-like protein